MVIIVVETSFTDVVVYAAYRGRGEMCQAYASGDVRILAFASEEAFRKAFPKAPNWDGKDSIYWEVKKEE